MTTTNTAAPTYAINCNWSELLYASDALKTRIDRIRELLHKAEQQGRKARNETHLRSELAALENVRVQMEQRHDEHMAIVRRQHPPN